MNDLKWKKILIDMAERNRKSIIIGEYFRIIWITIRKSKRIWGESLIDSINNNGMN